MRELRKRKKVLEKQIEMLAQEKKELLLAGYRQRITLWFSNGRQEDFVGPAVVMKGDEGTSVRVIGWSFSKPYKQGELPPPSIPEEAPESVYNLMEEILRLRGE